MKKYLISTLGLAVALFVFSTEGFSQSIYINVNAPINDFYGHSLSTGASIMLVQASAQTVLNGTPSAPVLGNPYFLSNGDHLANIIEPGVTSSFSVMPYLPDFIPYPMFFLLDKTGMTVGSKVSFYVRVFDNISGTPVDPTGSFLEGIDMPPNGFDSAGNWNNSSHNPIDKGVFYFDTPLFEVTIQSITDVPAEYIVNLGSYDEITGLPTSNIETLNPFIPPASAPVPEPGIMLLMAGGLCWIFGRLRKR